MALDLPTVFFHELGHFIAHVLNEIHFGGPPVISVSFYPNERPDRQGETTISDGLFYHPEGPHFLARLPQYLASLVYGCYFETYYLRKVVQRRPADQLPGAFQTCYSGRGAGSGDAGRRGDFLDGIGLVMVKEQFSIIEDAYFQKLVNGNHLDPFMALKPTAYIPDRLHLHADLEQLSNDTRTTIAAHSPLYLSFVTDLAACLEKASRAIAEE